MKTKNILLIILFSVIIAAFGSVQKAVAATNDLDKELIIKGDHGGDQNGLGPRSVTSSLKDAIAAYQNDNNLRVELVEPVGNLTISIVNAVDLSIVYQVTINTILEDTQIIGTSALQPGLYKLTFVDQSNRKASADFRIKYKDILTSGKYSISYYQITN